MERFTLRKIGKKLLPVAFGLGIMAVGNANTAQAEEVTSLENKTTEETNTTKEEVAKVTEAQVQEAKTELDNKTTDANKKAEEVSGIEKQANAETTIVENLTKEVAELEEINKEATPEKIQETKDAIAKTETEITNTQAELETKKQEVVALETAKTQAKAEELAKLEAEKTAKEELAKAQTKQEEAEAILKGTDQAKVVEELQNSKEALANAEKTLAEKTTALETAKQADATREQELAKAQAELTEAERELQEAQLKATTTQSAYNTAKSDLDTTQTELTKAQAEVDSINTITLSKEYIDNLKKIYDFSLTSEERDAAEKKLTEINEQELANNKYKANPNDDKTTLYDVNNLPENIRKELSLFASDLVNQIRKQVGTPKTTVTQSSLDFAKKVGDVYVRDGFDAWSTNNNLLGHNAKGINEVASEYGLLTSPKDMEAKGGQYYENWAGRSAITAKLSYSKLKENTYDSILGFMFNGIEWAHAESVAGIDNTYAPEEEYLGIDFAKVGRYGGFHLLMVKKSYVEKSTKNNFDTKEIPNPNTSEKLLAQLEAKKQELTVVQAEVTKLEAEKTKAQTELTTATQTEATAQTKVDTLTNTPLQTPQAQTEKQEAEVAKTQAEARVEKAQQAYDLLNADVKEKEANVEKAKAEVKAKETALTQASEEYKQALSNFVVASVKVQEAQAEVSKIEKQITELQTKLAEDKAYLTKLENAPVLLAEAKDKQEKAKANLILTKEKLAKELAKLQDLLKAKQISQENYDKLVQQLELQERLYIYQTGAGTIAVPKVAPTLEEKPELSLEQFKKEGTNTENPLGQTTNNKPNGNTEKVLPKTTAQRQTANTQAGMTLAGALALAGLVAGRRKERE